MLINHPLIIHHYIHYIHLHSDQLLTDAVQKVIEAAIEVIISHIFRFIDRNITRLLT